MTTVKWILVLSMVNLVTAQEVVNTTSGQIRGVRIPVFQATQYLGIPYAEAPVGNLRFKPPVRKSRVKGVFNASSSDFICPQFQYSGSLSSRMTEDCLRLDIYVPDAKSSGQLAVMIWLHGGWYVSGDTTSYNSLRLSSIGDVIVVAVNYRLGILGFLNTEDENSVGNFGLRDQCSAIDWVVDNIEKFGGNAGQVTIFGQEAGASSALQLAMSSLCIGRFQRVIAQSGSPSAVWAYNNSPNKSVDNLARTSRCPRETTALLSCLKNKTWQEIITFQNESYHLSDWAPSYSGDVFPDSPIEIIEGKNSPGLQRFRSIDLMTGLCNEEGEVPFLIEISKSNSIPRTINESDAVLSDKVFNKLLQQKLELYYGMDTYEINRLFPILRGHNTDWKRPNEIFSNTRMMIRFYGDILFNNPAVRVANQHSAKKQPKKRNTSRRSTYFYQFKPKGSWIKNYQWTVGSTNGEDVYFVFGFVNLISSTSNAEKRLATRIGNYWTNFAKSGSPNGPVLVSSMWPEYNTSTGNYIELDIGPSNSYVSTYPYARRFAFWEKLFLPELQRVRADRQKMEPMCSEKKDTRSGSRGHYSDRIHTLYLFIGLLGLSLILLI